MCGGGEVREAEQARTCPWASSPHPFKSIAAGIQLTCSKCMQQTTYAVAFQVCVAPPPHLSIVASSPSLLYSSTPQTFYASTQPALSMQTQPTIYAVQSCVCVNTVHALLIQEWKPQSTAHNRLKGRQPCTCPWLPAAPPPPLRVLGCRHPTRILHVPHTTQPMRCILVLRSSTAAPVHCGQQPLPAEAQPGQAGASRQHQPATAALRSTRHVIHLQHSTAPQQTAQHSTATGAGRL
jgi:hypothetical protein